MEVEDEEVKTPETPEKSDSPKGKKETPAPSNNDEKSLLLEKIDALHADLRKERGTIKDLKKERDTLAGQVTEFTLKDKKQTALTKALSEIGEDFEVPSEKMAELNELVADLKDSEELEAKVAKFVGLVKTTKAKAPKITTPSLPGTKPAAEKPDAAALYELAKTNPEAFREAVRAKMGRA